MQPLNYKTITDQITKFICRQVDDASATGVVFGLSGGIDSTVIAYLAKKALGDRCLALILPNSKFTPDFETNDGLLVARNLGMRHIVIPIDTIADTMINSCPSDPFINNAHKKKTIGNLNARIRAMLLYYEGQKNNYLVIGTDNRSEFLIGYFTKYGDGACDMLPIAELYKTQVRSLGKFLGIPSHIIKKQSGPYLWEDHTAIAELGVDYEHIDQILECIQHNDDDIATKLGIDSRIVDKVISLNRGSNHKRRMPPIAKLSTDDVL